MYAIEDDGFDIGPARRVVNLLFLRGTLPEDRSDDVLPTVEEKRIQEITDAFRARPGDRTTGAYAIEDLDGFSGSISAGSW